MLPTFVSVLICDDIRREVSNKDILIGVYSADIVVPNIPAWIDVAVWLEVEPKAVGSQDVDFRIGITGQPAAQIKLTLQVNSLKTFSAALRGMQFLVEKSGDLLVEVKDGEGWVALKRKQVLLGPPPPGALPGIMPALPSRGTGN